MEDETHIVTDIEERIRKADEASSSGSRREGELSHPSGFYSIFDGEETTVLISFEEFTCFSLVCCRHSFALC